MSVHYKFKSAVDYDTLPVDGVNISLADLKEAIIHQKRLGKSQPYDLLVTNAETKEVYTDDRTLIPKNSSLIIARMPIDPAQLKKSWDGNREPAELLLHNPEYRMNTEGADEAEQLSRKLEEIPDLTKLQGTEEDKIAAMMAQSTIDYHPSRYVKLRNTYMSGKVPVSYKCHKCFRGGHWVAQCPLNNQDFRKSSGIPTEFLVEVEDPNTPGAMLTSHGKFVIFRQNLFTGEATLPPAPTAPPPSDLVCTLCNELTKDAVLSPCCAMQFCDECLRNYLLESEFHMCPSCTEKDISPDSIIPSRYLRVQCRTFSLGGYEDHPKPKIMCDELLSLSPITLGSANGSPERKPVETKSEISSPPDTEMDVSHTESKCKQGDLVSEAEKTDLPGDYGKATEVPAQDEEKKVSSEAGDAGGEDEGEAEEFSKSKKGKKKKKKDEEEGRHKKKKKKEKDESKKKKKKKEKKAHKRKASQLGDGGSSEDVAPSSKRKSVEPGGTGNREECQGTTGTDTSFDLMNEALIPSFDPSVPPPGTLVPMTPPKTFPVASNQGQFLAATSVYSVPKIGPQAPHGVLPHPSCHLYSGGVIDDPLLAFEMKMREKDERERRRRMRSHSGSRTPPHYRHRSRSRSRQRSWSRPPVRSWSRSRSRSRSHPRVVHKSPSSARRRYSRSPSPQRHRWHMRSPTFHRERSPSFSRSPSEGRRFKTSPINSTNYVLPDPRILDSSQQRQFSSYPVVIPDGSYHNPPAWNPSMYPGQSVQMPAQQNPQQMSFGMKGGRGSRSGGWRGSVRGLAGGYYGGQGLVADPQGYPPYGVEQRTSVHERLQFDRTNRNYDKREYVQGYRGNQDYRARETRARKGNEEKKLFFDDERLRGKRREGSRDREERRLAHKSDRRREPETGRSHSYTPDSVHSKSKSKSPARRYGEIVRRKERGGDRLGARKSSERETERRVKKSGEKGRYGRVEKEYREHGMGRDGKSDKSKREGEGVQAYTPKERDVRHRSPDTERLPKSSRLKDGESSLKRPSKERSGSREQQRQQLDKENENQNVQRLPASEQKIDSSSHPEPVQDNAHFDQVLVNKERKKLEKQEKKERRKHEKKKKKERRRSSQASTDASQVETTQDEDERKKRKKDKKEKSKSKKDPSLASVEGGDSTQQTSEGAPLPKETRSGTSETLAHIVLPEPSKWERDDDVPGTPSSSTADTSMEEESLVTSDVLKRAENALYSKAFSSRHLVPNKPSKDSIRQKDKDLRRSSSPELDRLDQREAKRKGTSIQITISSKTESQIGRPKPKNDVSQPSEEKLGTEVNEMCIPPVADESTAIEVEDGT